MKTTQNQFNEFKEHCIYWMERYGIKDWDYVISLKNIKNEAEIVIPDMSDKLVYIYLNTDSDKLYSLEDLAHHEILELMLIKISNMLEKLYNSELVEEEIHGIIHKIINSRKKFIKA